MKKTFTLVELIIVIAIIVILAVLSFVYLNDWLAKSRDSRRSADFSTITKGLELYYYENVSYPKPSDDFVSITTSGSESIIGYQGNFGSDNSKAIGLNTSIKDPNTDEFYTYRVNADQTNYSILSFLEDKTSYNRYDANATDYANLHPKVSGEAGVITDAEQIPIQYISGIKTAGYLDIFNTISTYRVYISSTDYIEGTGISLQGIQQFGDNGYSAPLSCPQGFIPVPGNKEFHQAGFCVAKYEMKQIDGTSGNPRRDPSDQVLKWLNSPTEICGDTASTICRDSEANSGAYTGKLDKKIISKPDGMPIANLNQSTAIRACQQMGTGYHLITNNERMTIARNIENQGENWTGGKVGVGGIYRGKTYANTSDYTLDSDPKDLDCRYGMTRTGADFYKSVVQDGNSKSCEVNGRNKRALKLSNNQWIRDFAGNIWEHVNGENTINGTGYNSVLATACSNAGDGSATFYRYSFLYNSDIDGTFEQCNFTNGYSYNTFGPKTAGLDASNGIGRIYSSTGGNLASDRVMLRGGSGILSSRSGIYAIYLSWKSSTEGEGVGFRCTK